MEKILLMKSGGNSFITRSSPPLRLRSDFENLLQTDSTAGRVQRQCLAVATKSHIFLGEINVWSWRMHDLYLPWFNIIPDLTGNHSIKTWWCDGGRLVHVVTSPYKSYPECSCWQGETKGTFLTTWEWQSIIWMEILAPAFKISS